VKARPIPRKGIARVLVRFPNWLGDTVLALPTLRALRGALQAAEVWALGPWVGSILESEPGLARRVVTPGGVVARLAQARRLEQARFDLALILPNSLETGLAARLSGARWRVGYGEGRARLLTHAVPTPPGPVHQVASYLRLLAPLGIDAAPSAPVLAVDPARRVEARRLLEDAGVPSGAPRVGLQLGAALGPAKLWPAARVAALASRLESQGVEPVLLGSPQAVGLAAAVEAEASRPIRSLVGRDRPALLPALLAELDALVGADSGPAHVAAAVGVPAVTLFGPTDPRLTAPVGPGQRALWHRPACAPCFLRECPIDHRCLEAIHVDEVEAAVLAVVARRR